MRGAGFGEGVTWKGSGGMGVLEGDGGNRRVLCGSGCWGDIGGVGGVEGAPLGLGVFLRGTHLWGWGLLGGL